MCKRLFRMYLTFHVRGHRDELPVELDSLRHPDSRHGSPSLTASSALSSTLVHRRGDYQLRAVVPADREQDHLRFKLAPLEQSGNRWDTEHPSILAARLSGQASKVATLPPGWLEPFPHNSPKTTASTLKPLSTHSAVNPPSPTANKPP
jgi:hypothetical protein